VPPPKASGVVAFIKKYFLSFSMVLGLGFLLLVSLLLEAGLAILGEFLKPGCRGCGVIVQGARFWVVSFGITTLLFCHALPSSCRDAKVAWRDVWTGARC